MKLVPLTKRTAIDCVAWRNECLEALRTPFALTEEQQAIWWDKLQDRDSPHRYFQDEKGRVVCGLTNIDWTNRNAEISLIVEKRRRGLGIGGQAFREILEIAAAQYNLHMVYGECYHCNSAYKFWQKLIPDGVWLPHRKYWNGKYHDSYYFWVIND